MGMTKHIDINNPAQVHNWLVARFPNRKPENAADKTYQVLITWPMPFKRDGNEPHEILGTIDEWCTQLWKAHSLRSEFEFEFFHVWGYAMSGQLSLALSSEMAEALCDAMARAPYFLLTYPGFCMKFTSN
jgi:hypothetical protein